LLVGDSTYDASDQYLEAGGPYSISSFYKSKEMLRMSILRKSYTKLHVLVIAAILVTTMHALPMFFSDMADLVEVPTVLAGDPVFGDGGCC